MDVPSGGMALSLHLSSSEAVELQARAHRAGLSVSEAATAIVTSLLASDP